MSQVNHVVDNEQQMQQEYFAMPAAAAEPYYEDAEYYAAPATTTEDDEAAIKVSRTKMRNYAMILALGALGYGLYCMCMKKKSAGSFSSSVSGHYGKTRYYYF